MLPMEKKNILLRFSTVDKTHNGQHMTTCLSTANIVYSKIHRLIFYYLILTTLNWFKTIIGQDERKKNIQK